MASTQKQKAKVPKSAAKKSAKRVRTVRIPKQILVAEPAGFPGLRIPLVSEDVRVAMGLPEVRFPPKETWTEGQRKALDELSRILVPAAMYEAVHLMAQVKLEPGEESDLGVLERHAAGEASKLLSRRTWKAAGDFQVPKFLVEEILTRISTGALSLLADRTTPKGKGRKRKR